jgi:Na+/H+ antiporter NhaA
LARTGVASPNERLQQLYHRWTSYGIVPLFAPANAGITISADSLGRAYTSPVTLGVLVDYLAGKPVGILGFSWLVIRLSRGRLSPPVGWAVVAGGGAITGIGFTVALLIATLAFSGTQLEQAKVGILSAALCAAVVTSVAVRVTALLPSPGADPCAAGGHRPEPRPPRRAGRHGP